MNEDSVNLSNCDREPIHIPGAIQPHGALVALDRETGVISHASQNLRAYFGVEATEAIGNTLGFLLDEEDAARIIGAPTNDYDERTPYYFFPIRSKQGSALSDAIVHRSANTLIVEFELARDQAKSASAETYWLTQRAVALIRKSASLMEMYEACARSIRQISGFDRVMVYRFDENWNGSVISEDRRDDLEPFIGLHYPASDIPSQARELYARNWLRFIADRDYTPIAILPEAGPESIQPLDLSHSVLRSVSPIHLEYLRNMGVGASMSISILKDDKLWGLVACHHYGPRYVPYEVRTACELLGQVMSMQLIAKEESDLSSYSDHMKVIGTELASKVEHSEDLGAACIGASPNLLDLLDAGGAAIVIDNEVVRIGQTPGVEDVLRISDWLLENQNEEVFATDRVGQITGIHALGSVASGILAIPVTHGRRHQIIWFRPEQIRTVNWAGDPSKSLAKGDSGVRLSPRGSFALWKQTVRGQSHPWTTAELAGAADFQKELAGALLRRAEIVARQNRDLKLTGARVELILESERAAREQAERLGRLKDEFVATLSHELRTPLNAILGWSQLLRHGASDPGNVLQTVEVIERNARVQAKMIEDLLDISRIVSGKLRLDIQPVNLPGVVLDALSTIAPAAEAKGVRIDRLIDPLPGVVISGDPDRLQQVIWNLLSNAVKFTPKGGKVQVIVERIDSHVEISISDTGQGIAPEFLPHVFDRFRQEDASTNRRHGGLGLGLSIVRHLVEMHGGTVLAESQGEGHGACFVISLPLRAVSRRSDRPGSHPTHSMTLLENDPLDLKGVRALVVDDEPDARELIRRVLLECGSIAETADSAVKALELFRVNTYDVIISDIGMPRVDGYALIERIRRLETELGRPRIPAVALTAYARPEDRRRIMLAGYQFHLSKPVEPAEITAVVANLVGRV